MPEVSPFAREAIAQILELSAAAKVARRKAEVGSPAFFTLTGIIAAYAKVLALLTAVQRVEAFYARSEQGEVSNRDKCVDAVPDYKGPSHDVAEKLSSVSSAVS